MKRREQDEQDLRDEIQFHLAEEAKRRIDAGDAADEAATARGGIWQCRADAVTTRDTWSYHGIETTWQDVRYGLRLLSRYRLFATFSILALGLGIGGTTAIFTLYNAIVLRALPVHDPDSLIALAIQGTRLGSNSCMPYPQFEAMRQQNRTHRPLRANRFPSLSVSAHGRRRSRPALPSPATIMGRSACGQLPDVCYWTATTTRSRQRRRAQLRLLATSIRRRSWHRRPDDHAESRAIHGRRCRTQGLLWRHHRNSTPDVTMPLRGSPEVTGGRL